MHIQRVQLTTARQLPRSALAVDAQVVRPCWKASSIDKVVVEMPHIPSVFAYSYHEGENLIRSFELGVFGAPDDGTGLGSKVGQLKIGDLLLIRLTDEALEDMGTLRFAPLCRIVGRVFDQRGQSPFRKYLWPDEERASAILYPFRCAIERLGRVRGDVAWTELDSLAFKNQKGELLRGRQMWAAKLRGNVFSQQEARALFELLGPPA